MDQLDLLHSYASHCRDLADTAITPEGREILLGLARNYDDQAANLQATDTRPLFLFNGDSKKALLKSA